VRAIVEQLPQALADCNEALLRPPGDGDTLDSQRLGLSQDEKCRGGDRRLRRGAAGPSKQCLVALMAAASPSV
jgi:hypothetical protein